jgi:hypothetical protein
MGLHIHQVVVLVELAAASDIGQAVRLEHRLVSWAAARGSPLVNPLIARAN